MRKNLTSRLTIFYKVILPATWALIVVGLMIFIFVDSKDPMTFLMILMSVPMLVFTKLKQISYDDKNIYVYNWLVTKTYELKDIEAINEGYVLSLDPFFEIEIRGKNGAIETVHFMPRMVEQLTFMFTKKYTGYLGDIKTRIAERAC
jgi:hypothetical protein